MRLSSFESYFFGWERHNCRSLGLPFLDAGKELASAARSVTAKTHLVVDWGDLSAHTPRGFELHTRSARGWTTRQRRDRQSFCRRGFPTFEGKFMKAQRH